MSYSFPYGYYSFEDHKTLKEVIMQKIYTILIMASKQTLIGLGLISLMFASTVAFAFTQVTFFSAQGQEETLRLPAEKIITSPITPRQEAFLRQSGFTIMTLKYNLNCSNCLEAKNLAETITLNSEFSDQIYLVELEDNSLTTPYLELRSAFGARDMSSNITQENILDALCTVVARPPFSCVRGV